MGIPVESYERRDLRRSLLYAEAVPAVPPPPLHVCEHCSLCHIRLLRATLTVVGGTCGILLLRTDSSGANPCSLHLANYPSKSPHTTNRMTKRSAPTDNIQLLSVLPFCFCGAVELYGILGNIWGKMYTQRFMSIFSENTTVPSPIPTHHPPISQTAFFAHMPFEPPACERGHGPDYGKAGSGEGKSECLVLAQKAELFTEPKRRQPGTAASGSSLPSLYTTYVRVRVSAGKAARALPPSSVCHLSVPTSRTHKAACTFFPLS